MLPVKRDHTLKRRIESLRMLRYTYLNVRD